MESDKERWVVFYTAPRAEKAVNFRLQKKGYNTFLPLYLSGRVWKDRKKTIEMPLFASYIFVKAKDEIIGNITGIPGIVKVVYDQGQPAVITEEQVAHIHEFLKITAGYRVAIAKGDEVKINRGLLSGKSGEIIRIGKEKVLLHIKQLGLSAVAEVDRTDIEVLA